MGQHGDVKIGGCGVRREARGCRSGNNGSVEGVVSSNEVAKGAGCACSGHSLHRLLAVFLLSSTENLVQDELARGHIASLGIGNVNLGGIHLSGGDRPLAAEGRSASMHVGRDQEDGHACGISRESGHCVVLTCDCDSLSAASSASYIPFPQWVLTLCRPGCQVRVTSGHQCLGAFNKFNQPKLTYLKPIHK